MALFQRKPQTSDPKSFFTLGLNKTVLIVGLGNPGSEYSLTRHNIGFACVDAFATSQDFPGWIAKKDLKCELTQTTLGDTRVILVKPTTFMNLSGEAVQAVCNFYKINPESVIVVHDELDIEFGEVRSRSGGGAAGHNGIKSLIQHIGDGFGRVRIGIGPKKPSHIDSADFVLQKFSKQEMEYFPQLKREISAILSEASYGGGQLPTDTRNFLI